MLGMINKVKDYVTWGEVRDDVVEELRKKKLQTYQTNDGKKEENYDSDAFDALISLGFSYDQARSSLSQVSKDLSVEKKVQEALRLLGKK